LPVDEAVADSYGRLGAAVVRAGRRPRTRAMDLLIAATAHAHDAASIRATPTIWPAWSISWIWCRRDAWVPGGSAAMNP
jgi:hypothetical protein